MIGRKFAHYEITSQLGKGGMGEVYQAKDTKLGRDVAIKILPEEFARDADRVARFQREAKLLASLNHPNIAAIYGLEESDGTNFLVMELIEGQTLADRIKTGPIPVEEALKLALQIAEALEAAHEKGVIHRDLKPANIKVTPEDKVKVLDFGLAKAFAEEQGEERPKDSPTLSDAATRQGIILGTAAYMSPEQARGKPVDRRADIWAFGVVLYEMLAGKMAFSGGDQTDTLAAVIRSEPEWKNLPANLHWRLREVLERCLEKKAKDRCSGISDARVEIQKVLADPSGVYSQSFQTEKPRKKLQVGISWIAITAIICIIIAGISIWFLKPIPPPEPKQVMRFENVIPEIQPSSPTTANLCAISPDGKQIVYCMQEGIYIRPIDQLDAKLISGTKNSTSPFFSPDGQWIGFHSLLEGQIKKIPIIGGAVVPLCNSGMAVGASWNEDGTIVYGDFYKGIFRVSENGGTPELLVKQENASLGSPQLLPGGKTLLFTQEKTYGDTNIVVQSLESGEREVLFPGGGPKYIPTGHLIYGYENNLFAVPFDVEALKVVGSPVSIVQGIFQLGTAPYYAVSDAGTLVYITESIVTSLNPKSTIVWVDQNGKEEPLKTDPGIYLTLKISPNGKGVAITISEKSNLDIWVLDLLRNNMRRLTFNENQDIFPLWTPDSQNILYFSDRKGDIHIHSKAANGTGDEKELVSASDRIIAPCSWSSDGNTLVTWEIYTVTFSSDIGIFAIEGEKSLKPLLADKKYNESAPQVSPDGQWLAYQSDESGKFQVYVCSFPQVTEGKWQVSIDGGISPRWSPDGSKLYYWKDNSLISVDVETDPIFNPGKEEVLFEGNYVTLNPGMPQEWVPWDVHPDGNKFLMLKSVESDSPEGGTSKINIVLNWFEELKQRVPVD